MSANPRTAARLAWSAFALVLAFEVGAFAINARSGPGLTAEGVVFGLAYLAFGLVGALISARQPGNRIGALYLVMGLSVAGGFFGDAYALAEPPLPGREWGAWASSWTWAVGLTGVGFVLLLFPDGHLPARRWRVVGWLNGMALASLALAGAFHPVFPDYPGIPNPLGVPFLTDVFGPTAEDNFGWLFLGLGLLGSAMALVVRFRRSTGVAREQLKWLAASAVTIGLAWIFLVVMYEFAGLGDLGVVVVFLAVTGLPVATGIAILKHGLFDIDLVISRALVYGALAVFIGGVYAILVALLGSVVEFPNATLQIAATAVVAVAFHPLRARLQRVANRIVYGRRASPYEVLSGFSERVAGTYDTEDVLPRMARVLAEGTGGQRATVWLRVGRALQLAASWPAGGPPPAPLPVVDEDTLPDLPDTDRAVAVRHQGQLLGALAVSKRPGESLNPAEEALLTDLASQAGLVVRNVRLTADLQARLDQVSRQAAELRRSRQRIVEAQDAERRRLERNIHDGAQQHLVALAVKLRLAQTLASRDAERARGLVAEARDQAASALETLRDLAGGIYPPMLGERGLADALAAHAASSPIPVEIEDRTSGRHTPEAEAAVYFSVLEALQNAAKHAGGSGATVRLEDSEGELRFSVADRGPGFDPATVRKGSGLQNLSDRLEALGGSCHIRTRPGQGTTVEGRIPLTVGVPA